MSAPEPQVRDADLDAAILTGQIAVRDMAADWYCPRNAELPRHECRECVAEVAVRAVYARWDARDKAERALIEQWRERQAKHSGFYGESSLADGYEICADELERAIGDGRG